MASLPFRKGDEVPIENGMYLLRRNAIMGTVAQVKMPMRLIRHGFGVKAADVPGAGDHAVLLVRGVMVIIHANGVRQPGSILADIRGKGSGDGYLATKDYADVNGPNGGFARYRNWYITAVAKEVDDNVVHVFFESEQPAGDNKRTRSSLPADSALADSGPTPKRQRSQTPAAAAAAATPSSSVAGGGEWAADDSDSGDFIPVKRRARASRRRRQRPDAARTPQGGETPGAAAAAAAQQAAAAAAEEGDAIAMAMDAAVAMALDAAGAAEGTWPDQEVAADTTAAAAAMAAAAAAAAAEAAADVSVEAPTHGPAAAGAAGAAGDWDGCSPDDVGDVPRERVKSQCSNYVADGGITIWRRKPQQLLPSQAIPFLRHAFLREELGMHDLAPTKAVTFVVYENGVRVEREYECLVKLSGSAAYMVVASNERGDSRAFKERYMGWNLLATAAESTSKLRLYMESENNPEALGASLPPPSQEAAAPAAAAAAGAGAAGAARRKPGGRARGRGRGRAGRSGSVHWGRGGVRARTAAAAAAGGPAAGKGGEYGAVAADSSRDLGAAAGWQQGQLPPRSPAGRGRGRGNGMGCGAGRQRASIPAAATSSQPKQQQQQQWAVRDPLGFKAGGGGEEDARLQLLPFTASLPVMRAALAAAGPLLVEGGVSESQSNAIAAAFTAAAAAPAAVAEPAASAAAADPPKLQHAAVLGTQLQVLYGWLRFWCKRGNEQQVKAVVQQLVELGSAAVAADAGASKGDVASEGVDSPSGAAVSASATAPAGGGLTSSSGQELRLGCTACGMSLLGCSSCRSQVGQELQRMAEEAAAAAAEGAVQQQVAVAVKQEGPDHAAAADAGVAGDDSSPVWKEAAGAAAADSSPQRVPPASPVTTAAALPRPKASPGSLAGRDPRFVILTQGGEGQQEGPQTGSQGGTSQGVTPAAAGSPQPSSPAAGGDSDGGEGGDGGIRLAGRGFDLAEVLNWRY